MKVRIVKRNGYFYPQQHFSNYGYNTWRNFSSPSGSSFKFSKDTLAQEFIDVVAKAIKPAKELRPKSEVVFEKEI